MFHFNRCQGTRTRTSVNLGLYTYLWARRGGTSESDKRKVKCVTLAGSRQDVDENDEIKEPLEKYIVSDRLVPEKENLRTHVRRLSLSGVHGGPTEVEGRTSATRTARCRVCRGGNKKRNIAQETGYTKSKAQGRPRRTHPNVSPRQLSVVPHGPRYTGRRN